MEVSEEVTLYAK